MNSIISLILKVKDATSAVANVDDYNGSAQLLAATTLRFLAMLVALAPNLVSLLVATLRCFGMAGMFLQCGYLRKLIVPFFSGMCWGQKTWATSFQIASPLLSRCRSPFPTFLLVDQNLILKSKSNLFPAFLLCSLIPTSWSYLLTVYFLLKFPPAKGLYLYFHTVSTG